MAQPIWLAWKRRWRRIVADVRKNGDQALRRYAEKLDGLKAKQPLRVTDAELEQAWNAVSEDFKQALEDSGRQHPAILRMAKAAAMAQRSIAGNQRWAGSAAIAVRRLLRSRRPLSAAFHHADDGNSRPGGRRSGDPRGLSSTCAGDSCHRTFSRRARVLQNRRRASHCRVGIWNSICPESRQDCWTWKSLCNRGKKACCL